MDRAIAEMWAEILKGEVRPMPEDDDCVGGYSVEIVTFLKGGGRGPVLLSSPRECFAKAFLREMGFYNRRFCDD